MAKDGRKMTKKQAPRIGHTLMFCFKCMHQVNYGTLGQHHREVHAGEPVLDMTMCLVPRDSLRPFSQKATVDATTNTESNTISDFEELPFSVAELASMVLESHKSQACQGCYWQETYPEMTNHDYGCQATVERIVELHMTDILDTRVGRPVSDKLRIDLCFQVRDIVAAQIDGAVISSRVQVIFDDLLWVATIPQLRSAISVYRYIMQLVQAAAEQWKSFNSTEDAQPLSSSAARLQVPTTYAKNAPSAAGNLPSAFQRFDILETSYHFYAGCVAVHICDDTSDMIFPTDWNIKDASIQVSISKLAADFYPYHLADGDRSHWIHYKGQKSQLWVKDLLAHYENLIKRKLASCGTAADVFEEQWPTLNCCVVVLRVTDLEISCICLPKSSMNSKPVEQKLFCSDRESLKLPTDVPLIHMEWGDHYFPVCDKLRTPVPPRYSYCEVNPVRIYLESKTLRWLNYLYLDIFNRLDLAATDFESVLHCDIRVEALMQRIIVPCDLNETQQQPRKPSELHLQFSSAVLTNCGVGRQIKFAGLKEALGEMADKSLFVQAHPVCKEVLTDPLPTRTDALRQYFALLAESQQIAAGQSSPMPGERKLLRVGSAKPSVGKQALVDEINGFFAEVQTLVTPTLANDVWFATAQPLWIDFMGNRVWFPKPMPCLLDTSVCAYFLSSYNTMPSASDATQSETNKTSIADSYLLIAVESSLKLALNHYQYLFLLHQMDTVTSFFKILTDDFDYFTREANLLPKTFCISAFAPLVEVSIILPAQAPVSTYDEETLSNELNGARLGCTDSVASTLSGNVDVHVNTCDTIKTVKSPVSSDAKFVSPVLERRVESSSDFPTFSALEAQDLDSYAPSVIGDDAVSICTDVSDDDKFVLLDANEADTFEDIFLRKGESRPASAAEEADAAFMGEQSSANNRLCAQILSQKVCVVTACFADLEAVMVTRGQDSLTKLQSSTFTVEELSDTTTLNDLHVQLAGRTPLPPKSQQRPAAQKESYPFQLVMRQTAADAAVDDNGTMLGVLSNLRVALSNVALANLSSFLQDDRLTQKPFHSKILLKKCEITVTDPKLPIPFVMTIDDAVLSQDAACIDFTDDSLFSANSEMSATRNSSYVAQGNASLSECDRLRQENEQLKRQLNEALLDLQRFQPLPNDTKDNAADEDELELAEHF